VSKGIGVSRGDKRRNARLAESRRLVPRENAIAGIDLAEDNQAVVVTDHDSKVLVRRSPRCKAWQLGEVLDWAVAKAQARGFASVTVACEPTGSRWMHVQQACVERGLSFVCVQTLARRVLPRPGRQIPGRARGSQLPGAGMGLRPQGRPSPDHSLCASNYAISAPISAHFVTHCSGRDNRPPSRLFPPPRPPFPHLP
jgi:hypothetical protein